MGKKDFGSLKSPIGGNTALNFISADPIVNQEEAMEKKKVEEVEASNARKRVGRPKLRNKRDQRVTLLLKSSLYESMRDEVETLDMSMNEFYEMLLKEYFAKKELDS